MSCILLILTATAHWAHDLRDLPGMTPRCLSWVLNGHSDFSIMGHGSDYSSLMHSLRFIYTRPHLPPSFSAQFCHLSSQLWSSFSQLAMTFDHTEWLDIILKLGDFTWRPLFSRSLMKTFNKTSVSVYPSGTSPLKMNYPSCKTTKKPYSLLPIL